MTSEMEILNIRDDWASRKDRFREKRFFDNGYGISVIRHEGSYGYSEGLFEIAVLNSDGELDFSTEVTGDVVGWLDVAGVIDYAKRIQQLPAAVEIVED